jgi:hypothetical protein
MAKHQALWTNKVKQRSLPPHLSEFLTVSASYLEVSMDSLKKDSGQWQGNANVIKQNNQEVSYAANHV